NGNYDLRFTIYGVIAGGSAIGGPVTNAATLVSNGLFTTTVDFGAGVFDGSSRWLEIAVRTNGSVTDFTAVTPRQPITATPYAIFSSSSGSVSNGLIENPMFLGTTGDRPLELVAGGQRAMRLEPNTNGAPNVIGGAPVNQVDAGVVGATIGGGGVVNYFGGTFSNRVSGAFGTVGGGVANFADGFGSIIGGGLLNLAQGYGAVVAGGSGNAVQQTSTSGIGGGNANLIKTNANNSYIGGGYANIIDTDASGSGILGGLGNTNGASYAVLGGGVNNWIEPFADRSVIGGGWYNYIQGGADQSVIAGGNAGKIFAGARESFVGGGFGNTIGTNAAGSSIGAGVANTIGSDAYYSTIAGGNNNSIQSAAHQATIGGGANNEIRGSAFQAGIMSGNLNSISNDAPFSAIVGGVANHIGNNATYASVGGGNYNAIRPFSHFSTIAGGLGNRVLSLSEGGTISGGRSNLVSGYSVIGGGDANTNRGFISSIGGGRNNQIGALADHAVIAGGGDNQIVGSENLPIYGVIGGGQSNSIQTNAIYSTIGGGAGNRIIPNAQYATIPGGASNAVGGRFTFAGGRRAQALHDGSFVWADSTDADFASTAANQFNIRASGGVRLETTGTATLNGQPILSGGDSTNFWQLAGNNVRTGQFIGSTNNQPLEVRVNNKRALRIESGSVDANHVGVNVVGGSAANVVGPGVIGATIAGGGAESFFLSPLSNKVTVDFGAIGGGFQNVSAAFCAAVAGGRFNVASGQDSAVGGGYGNTNSGYAGAVPGGYLNVAGGSYSFAAGNRAKANHTGSFVWSDSLSADFSSTTNDQFSIRAQNGVRLNTDTPLLWGTGAQLRTDQGGSIELGNSLAAAGTPYIDFHYGTGSAQDHNVRLVNDADGRLTVVGNLAFGAQMRQMLNLWDTAYGIGIQSYRMYFRTDGPAGFAWFAGGTHNDNTDNPGTGGTEIMRLESNGNLSVRGVVAQNVLLTSDRTVKAGFQAVDAQGILEKVAALAITRWHYTNEPATDHVGPVAQDFHAAFELGSDDKHIAAVDANGVALAAIQGLHQMVKEKDAKIAALEKRLAKVEQLLSTLASSEKQAPK
ncbi:MAG TPA: tail fiber domain-containing protein, partial [Verrucomicrobiae bacterium]|nr:tail fiber domain-containing protein [Verrucomicrobiae bacterium]